MSKFSLPKFSWSSLFPRTEYDPTTFGAEINEKWDRTKSEHKSNSQSRTQINRFQNFNLPLAERIDELKQELEFFEKAIPNRKK